LGFRGKIDLIYIDPPFSSNKDYVRKIQLRGLKQFGRLQEDKASVLKNFLQTETISLFEYIFQATKWRQDNG